MLKAYKYRIYPTKNQEVLIVKHFGCVRWMYNWGLSQKIKAYENKEKLSCFDVINNAKILKESQDYIWLNEVNSQSLQIAARNLDNAFTRFFREKKGFPKFKSKKDNYYSFQCPQNVKINFELNEIKLPKFKEGIDIIIDRKFDGKIKTVTISKVPSGKYFASILVETNDIIPDKQNIDENTTIGIDTGIKTFLTCSNGKIYANNKYLDKKLKKLARLNKSHSRKQKGSKNKEKSRLKLTRLYEKITNQRKDYINKVTHELTNDNQVKTICVESLNIPSMMKNKQLSRNLSDVGLGLFYQKLEYKCEWNGINLIKIGQFEPSSKMCSKCGEVNHNLTLKDREWTCVCGCHHDRDLNAAINIKKFGLLSSKSKILTECKESTLGEIGISRSLNQEITNLEG